MRALTARERPGGTPPLSEGGPAATGGPASAPNSARERRAPSSPRPRPARRPPGPCPAWWTPPPRLRQRRPRPALPRTALAPLRDERARGSAWVERELKPAAPPATCSVCWRASWSSAPPPRGGCARWRRRWPRGRTPAWWPASLAAAAGAGPSEAELLAERRALAGRRSAHGRAIAEAQLALYAARRRGGGSAARARPAARALGRRALRGRGARVLLRSVFRAAAARAPPPPRRPPRPWEAGEKVELLRLETGGR